MAGNPQPKRSLKPVTPAQISKKVQEVADARFGDVIEHLLYLLQQVPPYCSTPLGLVWKWKQTGLLDGIDDDSIAQDLAEKLEEAALQVNDWCSLEHPNDDEISKATDRFFDIRKKVIEEHECQRHYYTNKYGMQCSIWRGN